MKKSIFITLSSCVLILALGFWSGLSTRNEINNWYLHLNKPSWNPPNWIFAPVWSSIYLMIGIALALIIQRTHPLRNKAILIFIVQFGLNLLWTQLFFSYHMLFAALIEVIMLWISIIVNGILFYRIQKSAGLLFIPYVLWVSFASMLTLQIYILNP